MEWTRDVHLFWCLTDALLNLGAFQAYYIKVLLVEPTDGTVLGNIDKDVVLPIFINTSGPNRGEQTHSLFFLFTVGM